MERCQLHRDHGFQSFEDAQAQSPVGLDGFGFGQTWLNGGQLAGPILAGNPTWAPPGDGTCYQPNMTCPAGATGLGMGDYFAIGTPLNGCFFFGSGCWNIVARQRHLES